MEATAKRHQEESLADLMEQCNAHFDAKDAAPRHASFRSAQQGTQSAHGVSAALKLGMGLGLLVVIVAVAWVL